MHIDFLKEEVEAEARARNGEVMTRVLETYSDKVRLGNLYLYHVLAFHHNSVVVHADGTQREADERVMRFIETEGGVDEAKCVDFRKKVVEQLYERRMDYLYLVLGDSLELMCQVEAEQVQAWFKHWPTAMPVVEVPPPLEPGPTMCDP